jgi:hypothetical protein
VARTSGAVFPERSDARCRSGKEPFGVRRRTKCEPTVAQPAARWLGDVLVDGFSEPEALVELGQRCVAMELGAYPSRANAVLRSRDGAQRGGVDELYGSRGERSGRIVDLRVDGANAT